MKTVLKQAILFLLLGQMLNAFSSGVGIPLGLNTIEGGAWQGLISGNPAILAGNEKKELNLMGALDLGVSTSVMNYGAAVAVPVNPYMSLALGYLQGDSLQVDRAFNFTSYSSRTSTLSSSSVNLPFSVSAKIAPWFSFGLTTRFQTSNSFTLSQLALGVLAEIKNSFAAGIYLPQMDATNIQFNQLVAGLGYSGKTFGLSLDYLLQTASGKSSSVAFGLAFYANQDLQTSINFQLPMPSSGSTDGVLSALQVHVHLKYYLRSSFFVQTHIYSGGLVSGGMGLSF